ncbi:MAG: hypothetical protein FH748_05635 [Balneolaceae bacterium]|nr:hypothetical protein [Balneolaceae bacterium]
MKTHKTLSRIFLLLIFSSSLMGVCVAQTTNKQYQKLILEKMLKDHSIKDLVRRSDTYQLITNDKCAWKAGTVIVIDKWTIGVHEKKQANEKMLIEFQEYETTDKIIYVDIIFFSRGIHYRATYLKEEEKIVELMTDVFIEGTKPPKRNFQH